MHTREFANLRPAQAAVLWPVRCDIAALRFKLAAWRFRRALVLETRFNPNHDEAGRFTFADGAVSGGAGAEVVAGGDASDQIDSGTEFSPDRSGWHDYQSGPHHPCSTGSECSAAEMADYAARYDYPGQDPARPVNDRGVYLVYFPGTRIPAGYIDAYISADGLTITNVTQPLHLLYNGRIERTFRRTPDGTWQVVTHGIGNNRIPEMNVFNSLFGPEIFDGLDERLKHGIELHHGPAK